MKSIIKALKNKENMSELADFVEGSIRHTKKERSFFFTEYLQSRISKKYLKMEPGDII